MKTKLMQLIEEKTTEIFVEMQTEHSITNGNVHPCDAYDLEELQKLLAEQMEKILRFQMEV